MNCPDCGAVHAEDRSCQDDFYQLLYWENEHPALGAVHHLTVLCYHLQHPGLYSPDGLVEGRRLLAEFIEKGTSPVQIRRQNRSRVNSHHRTWKIKASPGSEGKYAYPVHWTMTAADVAAGGADAYCDNVRAWARSVLQSLRGSGNL